MGTSYVSRKRKQRDESTTTVRRGASIVWKFVAFLCLQLGACTIAGLPTDAGDNGSAPAGGSESGPLAGAAIDGSALALDVRSESSDAASESSDATNESSDATSESPTNSPAAMSDVVGDSMPSNPPGPCPDSGLVNGSCAPVCGAGNFGSGGLVDGGVIDVVAGLSEGYDWPLAITADGRVLHARGADPSQEQMLLSVPSAAALNGYDTFTLVDTADASAYPPIAPDVAALTLDGTTLIAATNSYDSIVELPLAGTQLGSPAQGHFAQLNAALPQGGVLVDFVVLSADGLTFYYVISEAADSTQNGIYAATRSSTSAEFAAGALLSGNGMQLFWEITGVSSDDLTLFLEGPGWLTYILTRPNKSVPWTADSVLVDGGLSGGMRDYFDAFPTPDCQNLLATCTPGGSSLAQICELPRLN